MIIDAVSDSYTCCYPRDAAAGPIIQGVGPTAGLNAQAERVHQPFTQPTSRDTK